MNKKALEELGVTEFDAANELANVEEAQEFLQACMDEAPEDGAFIAHALGVVARAQSRMAAIAGQSGLSRESLYKALSGRREPAFSTILKVAAALGFRLEFVPKASEPAPKIFDLVCMQVPAANGSSKLIEFINRTVSELAVDSLPVSSSSQAYFYVDEVSAPARKVGTVAQSLSLQTNSGDEFEAPSRPLALASTGATFIELGQQAVH